LHENLFVFVYDAIYVLDFHFIWFWRVNLDEYSTFHCYWNNNIVS